MAAFKDRPRRRVYADGRVIGRGLRLDIGHVRAVGRDDCLQKVVGGGDFGERGFHRDHWLRLA